MNQKELTDFENSISGLIGLSLTLHHLNKTLEVRCGVSVVQWALLKTLIGMPAGSPSSLSKALGVTPGTLSQTLNRLSKKGFLFMRSDPSDARKKMISITRQGKEVLDAADLEYREIFSDVNSIQGSLNQMNDFLRLKVKSLLTELTEFSLENDSLLSPNKNL